MNKQNTFFLIITAIAFFVIGRLSVDTSAQNTQVNVGAISDKAQNKNCIADAASSSSNHDIEESPSATSMDGNITSPSTCEQLEAKHNAIKQEMNEAITRAETKSKNLESKLTAAQNILEAQGKKFETISQEEAEAILPHPFADVLARSSGSLVKTFKELQTQEQDFEWAIQIQERISDFFITHPLSNLVSLQSVICKETICEIRGFEKQKGTIAQIMSEMAAQPWWQFNSTHSSSGDNEEFGRYFYIIASRKVINSSA